MQKCLGLTTRRDDPKTALSRSKVFPVDTCLLELPIRPGISAPSFRRAPYCLRTGYVSSWIALWPLWRALILPYTYSCRA